MHGAYFVAKNLQIGWIFIGMLFIHAENAMIYVLLETLKAAHPPVIKLRVVAMKLANGVAIDDGADMNGG